jgi:hypothetical protein
VRVPARRKDETYFEQAKRALGGHASVRAVETTSMTASILVLHEGDSAEILSDAERAGLFRVESPEHRDPTVVRWLDALDRFDSDFLFARMDQKPQRAATGLFMLAVLQALSGSILPSAPTLLGEAMRLLREARQRSERERRSDA